MSIYPWRNSEGDGPIDYSGGQTPEGGPGFGPENGPVIPPVLPPGPLYPGGPGGAPTGPDNGGGIPTNPINPDFTKPWYRKQPGAYQFGKAPDAITNSYSAFKPSEMELGSLSPSTNTSTLGQSHWGARNDGDWGREFSGMARVPGLPGMTPPQRPGPTAMASTATNPAPPSFASSEGASPYTPTAMTNAAAATVPQQPTSLPYGAQPPPLAKSDDVKSYDLVSANPAPTALDPTNRPEMFGGMAGGNMWGGGGWQPPQQDVGGVATPGRTRGEYGPQPGPKIVYGETGGVRSADGPSGPPGFMAGGNMQQPISQNDMLTKLMTGGYTAQPDSTGYDPRAGYSALAPNAPANQQDINQMFDQWRQKWTNQSPPLGVQEANFYPTYNMPQTGWQPTFDQQSEAMTNSFALPYR